MKILQLIYLFLIARHSEVFHFASITNSATRHISSYTSSCAPGGEHIQGIDLEVQLVCLRACSSSIAQNTTKQHPKWFQQFKCLPAVYRSSHFPPPK